jgi:hypothetical protein
MRFLWARAPLKRTYNPVSTPPRNRSHAPRSRLNFFTKFPFHNPETTSLI